MVNQKEIVLESSFAVTDMTTVASAVLFPSESKGSGFHANERPKVRSISTLSFVITARKSTNAR